MRRTTCLALALIPIVIITAAALAAEDGLIAYWSFDDSTATDVSGNDHDGTIQGAQAVHGLTQDGGNDGVALRLDGVDDYVDFANPAALNPLDELSVVVWFSPESFYGSGNDPILDKSYTSCSEPFYQYHLGVTGDMYWHDQAAFNFAVTANGQAIQAWTGPWFWTTGNWYYIVGTYDGTMVNLYVDAVLVDSQPLSGQMADYGQNLLAGRFGQCPCLLPGTIDELRLYGRALTQPEIDSLYIPIANSHVANDPRVPRISRVLSYPNPTPGAVTIRFLNPEDNRCVLSVLDVCGRQVATVLDAHLPRGIHSAFWDGRRTTGTPVESGVYFVRLRSGGATGYARATVLR